MNRFAGLSILALGSLVFAAVACDSSTSDPAPAGTGGYAATGGVPGATGGVPGATGGVPSTSSFTNGYGTSGELMGYAFTVGVGVGTTISPECNEAGTALCFTTTPGQLCATGSVGKDPAYKGVAMIGWNINQLAAPNSHGNLWTTKGAGLTIVATGSPRVQIQDNSGLDAGRWCAVLPEGGGMIPWDKFNTQCWDPSGPSAKPFKPGTPISQIAIVIPGKADEDLPFNMCFVSASVN